MTIWREKGRLDELTIGIVGDMKETRGMHSLLHCLGKFNLKLLLVSPKEIAPEAAMIDFLKKASCQFELTEDLKSAVPEMDVLYTTRLNKEGSPSEEAYQDLLQRYPRISLDLLKGAKKDLIVMHDLPRTDELGLQILPEIDNTQFARYFEEIEYGVAIRMALLALVLGAVE
jgi:aspartate carbamoyltransferase catalytic subunit